MPESSSSTSKIDFKKYNTPELATGVAEIVDVRGKLLTAFGMLFIGFAIFMLLAGILFWGKENFLTFGVSIAYSIVAGAVFSLAMAIVYVVNRSLAEMEQLVQLLFSTTNQVGQDVSRISDGTTELPSARELVEGVYGDVLLPTVEQVVAQSLGFLGRPLLFAYRMTLGRVVRTTIKMLPDSALVESGESVDSKAQKIVGNLKEISDEKSQILSILTWAQSHLESLGAKAQFLVLLPCYLIAGVAVLVIMIPLIAMYFWL